MKIVFTTDTIQRGGKERQLFILADQLLNKDYQIHIVSLKYSEKNYLSEYSITKDHITFINQSKLYLRYKNVKKTLKKIRPDLVLSWDMQTALFSLLLFKKYGFRFINGSIQHGIRLFKFSHLLRSLILWFSPYRLANSQAGFKANNLNPKNSKKNFVLYNGIERKFESRYTNEILKEKKQSFFNSSYDDSAPLFISVANFVQYKDYFTVIDALAELSYNFYYLILGDGPLREEIENRIKSYGLTNKIFILGKVDNVQQYLRMSDIFIHSSKGEGISNAILEAMFCGLPVIATKVGGTPELVYDKSVKLFNYKDKAKLVQLLNDYQNEFKNFDESSADYKEHLNQFSVSRMTSTFESIITKVVS